MIEVIDLKKNNISTGNCGEYFVAAELERRGFTAAVPMSNTPDFDVLAVNRETNKQYAIQVKTTSFGNLKWILGPKSEHLEGDNIFYIFVHLHELGTPEYYIIPSKVVAKDIRNGYTWWLSQTTKSGKPHNPNNVRNFIIKDEFKIYKDAWNLLV